MAMQKIESKIYEIRGKRVMFDFDLAELYEVETKVLNQSVKRNMKRFPSSFMLQLNTNEWNTMRSQIVTASYQQKRNIKALPRVFTVHGVTMLASVLRSDRAIQMNIVIVEAFIALQKFPPMEARLFKPCALNNESLLPILKSPPMVVRLSNPVSDFKLSHPLIRSFPPTEVNTLIPSRLIISSPRISTLPSMSVQLG